MLMNDPHMQFCQVQIVQYYCTCNDANIDLTTYLLGNTLSIHKLYIGVQVFHTVP